MAVVWGLHYHKTYAEAFECIEGEVEVRLHKTIHKLQPGQSATAAPNINHLFRNRSGKSCKFKVELRPASRGLSNHYRSVMAWPMMAFANQMDFLKIN